MSIYVLMKYNLKLIVIIDVRIINFSSSNNIYMSDQKCADCKHPHTKDNGTCKCGCQSGKK